MTIAELKALLNKYPDDLQIRVHQSTHWTGAGFSYQILEVKEVIDQDTGRVSLSIKTDAPDPERRSK